MLEDERTKGTTTIPTLQISKYTLSYVAFLKMLFR